MFIGWLCLYDGYDTYEYKNMFITKEIYTSQRKENLFQNIFVIKKYYASQYPTRYNKGEYSIVSKGVLKSINPLSNDDNS